MVGFDTYYNARIQYERPYHQFGVGVECYFHLEGRKQQMDFQHLKQNW